MLVQPMFLMVCFQFLIPAITAHQNNNSNQKERVQKLTTFYLNGAYKPLPEYFEGYPFLKMEHGIPWKMHLPATNHQNPTNDGERGLEKEGKMMELSAFTGKTEDKIVKERLNEDDGMEDKTPRMQNGYTTKPKPFKMLDSVVKKFLEGGKQVTSKGVFLGPVGRIIGRFRERLRVSENEIQKEKEGERMVREGEEVVKENVKERVKERVGIFRDSLNGKNSKKLVLFSNQGISRQNGGEKRRKVNSILKNERMVDKAKMKNDGGEIATERVDVGKEGIRERVKVHGDLMSREKEGEEEVMGEQAEVRGTRKEQVKVEIGQINKESKEVIRETGVKAQIRGLINLENGKIRKDRGEVGVRGKVTGMIRVESGLVNKEGEGVVPGKGDEVRGRFRARVKVDSAMVNKEGKEVVMEEKSQVRGRIKERVKEKSDGRAMVVGEGQVSARMRDIEVGRKILRPGEGAVMGKEEKKVQEKVRMEDGTEIVAEKDGVIARRMRKQTTVVDADVQKGEVGAMRNNGGLKGVMREQLNMDSKDIKKESLIEKQEKIKQQLNEIKKLINIVKELEQEN